jgi:hypothetical protein
VCERVVYSIKQLIHLIIFDRNYKKTKTMKRINATHLLVLAISFILYSCAAVKVYTDEGLTKRTGIKYYHSKPFLLVEKNSAKDIPLKTTVVYLPDMSKPYYAKTISGLGSNDLKISYENGAISSYGVVTDTKIPEAITSLTGLLTGYGGVVKSLAEAKNLGKADAGEQAQSTSIEDLKKAKEILDNVEKDLQKMNTTYIGKNLVSTNQETAFTNLIASNSQAIKILAPFKPGDTEKAVAEITKSIEFAEVAKSTQTNDAAKKYTEELEQLKGELTKAKNVLEPEAPSQSTFELYEIILTGTKTELKKVDIPKQ